MAGPAGGGQSAPLWDSDSDDDGGGGGGGGAAGLLQIIAHMQGGWVGVFV